MIGLDSNIILRALTGDDPIQSPLAQRLLATLSSDRPGVLNPVVLVETAWTLRGRYKCPRLEILQHIEKFMGSCAYLIVERDAVSEALETSRKHSIEFADALIGEINRLAGCATTMTFDEGAHRVPTFTQLQ
jgi:predicted nucleic-acid-binding protein